jgi:hypothetical protein
MARKRKAVEKKRYSKLIYFLVGVAVVVIGVSFFAAKQKDEVCANSVSCTKDLSGKFDPSAMEGEFMGKKVDAPVQLAYTETNQDVLGDTTASNKHIYIDLSTQKLYAKEGDRTVYEFPISSGKWGRTPTGTFSIWIKLQATRMTGGNKALGTYYDLPNVPWTMYFYNGSIPKWRGFGIHGAYWHNNFGHPMSHGCINMKPDDAKVIYDWANPSTTGYTTYATSTNPGTQITIYGTAPWQ